MNKLTQIRELPKEQVAFCAILAIFCMSVTFKNAIYQIFSVLIGLFFIIYIIKTRKFEPAKMILKECRWLSVCFVGIFLSMIISNLLNLDILQRHSWDTALLFPVRYGLIFFALAYFYTLGFFDENFILKSIFIGLLLLAIIGLIQLAMQYDTIFSVKGGFKGTFSHRNNFGFLAGLGLVMSVVFVKDNLIRIALIAVFLFLTIFSFSRGSWVGAFGAILIYGFLNLKFLNKKHVIAIILLIIALLSIYLLSSGLQARFQTLLEGDSAGRWRLWKFCLNLFYEKPIFGYGIDILRGFERPFSVDYPHNIWVEILLYTGLFGFIFYFGSILTTFFTCSKHKQISILAALFYLLIVTQFDHGAYMSKTFLSFVTLFTFLAFVPKFKELKNAA